MPAAVASWTITTGPSGSQASWSTSPSRSGSRNASAHRPGSRGRRHLRVHRRVRHRHGLGEVLPPPRSAPGGFPAGPDDQLSRRVRQSGADRPVQRPGFAGEMSYLELRIVRADDREVRWLARRGEYVRDIETADLRFTGVIYDVTDAKRSEEKLRELNETLETRVQERPGARAACGACPATCSASSARTARSCAVNPAWTDLLGYADHELIGTPCEALVSTEDLPLFRDQVALLQSRATAARLRRAGPCERWGFSLDQLDHHAGRRRAVWHRPRRHPA